MTVLGSTELSLTTRGLAATAERLVAPWLWELGVSEILELGTMEEYVL